MKSRYPSDWLSDEARDELSDWRRWAARAVVLLFAALAGLGVICLTWLTEQALHAFGALHTRWPWAPLLWTPALTAGIVWITRRFAPGAAGSGIPQVLAAQDPAVPVEHRPLFVSVRLALAKVVLTAGGLLAGLSTGREGPSVQVAAGLMHHARRWLPARSPVNERGLLVAIGIVTHGSTFGGGYGTTRALLEGQEPTHGLYVVLRMVVTWLSAWSGVPGGIFAPALAIGAGIGHDVAGWTGQAHPALIALGMAGFLAGATQNPFTAFIIVMEMVEGHAMVLSLMGCAMLSSGMAGLISPPLYVALAELQLRRLPAPPGTTP